MHEKELSRRIP